MSLLRNKGKSKEDSEARIEVTTLQCAREVRSEVMTLHCASDVQRSNAVGTEVKALQCARAATTADKTDTTDRQPEQPVLNSAVKYSMEDEEDMWKSARNSGSSQCIRKKPSSNTGNRVLSRAYSDDRKWRTTSTQPSIQVMIGSGV